MKILLVEDEPAALEMLRQGLELAFPTFMIATAASAEDAEARIADGFAPDLVVTDVRLPGRSGVDLLFRIQERSPEMRFILISGYTPPELARYAEGETVLRFLAKPFEMAQLVSAVQDAFVREQFSGSHRAISFIDILQVLNMSQRTALVELLDGERQVGAIYLVDGEVHHAESQSLEGEDAFRKLCASPDTAFRVRKNQRPPRRTIERSFGTLLIDVMSDED